MVSGERTYCILEEFSLFILCIQYKTVVLAGHALTRTTAISDSLVGV